MENDCNKFQSIYNKFKEYRKAKFITGLKDYKQKCQYTLKLIGERRISI